MTPIAITVVVTLLVSLIGFVLIYNFQIEPEIDELKLRGHQGQRNHSISEACLASEKDRSKMYYEKLTEAQEKLRDIEHELTHYNSLSTTQLLKERDIRLAIDELDKVLTPKTESPFQRMYGRVRSKESANGYTWIDTTPDARRDEWTHLKWCNPISMGADS